MGRSRRGNESDKRRGSVPIIGDQNNVMHGVVRRSEEHTSELQSLTNLVCRLLLEKKKEVEVAPLTLHAGVSSTERHKPPFPQEFEVTETTTALVNAYALMIVVETTVVRALESDVD